MLAVLVAGGICVRLYLGAPAHSLYGHGARALPAPVVLRLEQAPPVAGTLAKLRGHPVLFFNCGPEVSFVEYLAPLNRFQRGYAPKGLEVIGLYRGPRTPDLETMFRNAGVGWRVFHEMPGGPMTEWRERFKVPTYPSVVLLRESGDEAYRGSLGGVAAAIEKLLGPPAAVPPVIIPEVRGRLLHAGRPASVFTDDEARFGPFRDESTGRFVERDFRVSYDNGTGEFRIFNVPEGAYGVYVTCGPFWHNFRRFSATGPVPPVAELSLIRRMYLREPVDTSKDVATREVCRHRSPVTFRWDAVPGAQEYRPVIRRRRRGEAESLWQTVPVDPLKETSLSVEIQADLEYEFGLSAHGAAGTLAWLNIYQDGLGERYRFAEGDPPVEKEGR
ncbi:MAG: hypothetical protein FD180_3365 [Planctomycetota bacterium]|nr:MAG: hypothetical protein FD180_3365 [Planctomycetota bacterium]